MKSYRYLELISEIPNGECYIDGFANIKEANYLATQLKFGKFNLALKSIR